jgi:hypothetical protein
MRPAFAAIDQQPILSEAALVASARFGSLLPKPCRPGG